MQITKHFNLYEFSCKCGERVPQSYHSNVFLIASMLQRIRDQIGKPIIINSGYRTIEHNRKVGGANNSYHLTGSAVDIRVVGMDSIELYIIISELMIQGKIVSGGLILYNTFVHYDIRNSIYLRKSL